MPTPIPRPVTTFAVETFDAARRGVHWAARAAASSTPSQRGSVMLRWRNWYGSNCKQIRELIDGLLGRKGERKIQRRAQPSAL